MNVHSQGLAAAWVFAPFSSSFRREKLDLNDAFSQPAAEGGEEGKEGERTMYSMNWACQLTVLEFGRPGMPGASAVRTDTGRWET